jgi:hypothetical protein
MNWLMSQLFGTNWKANLTQMFQAAAIAYFAGKGAATEAQVQTWMETQVATEAMQFAKGNPLYAAILVGLADSFIPEIVGDVYSYVEKQALGTAPAAALSAATEAESANPLESAV